MLEKNYCYLKIQSENQHETAFWEILKSDSQGKLLIQYFSVDTRVSDRDPLWC